ncbi:MAG TPA: CBS domain-containing protein [Woeseiaceae bacterium]|nr:CBS domain-containing protein [Woeseiaceae bacterium]
MPAKSVSVKDYMSGRLVTFTPETDVLDVIHELVEHRIAGAPIVDQQGNLVGMISEFDCMQVVLAAGYHGHPGGPVSELMVTDVQTVDADMSIVDLAELFIESRFRRFPVLKDNRLVGQISRRDVLRALGEIARH